MSLNFQRLNEQLQNLKIFGRFLYFWHTRMTTVGKSFEKTRRELIGIIYFIIIYEAQYFVVTEQMTIYSKSKTRLDLSLKNLPFHVLLLLFFLTQSI